MNKFGFQTDKSNISFESHLVNLGKDIEILLVKSQRLCFIFRR